MSRMRDEQRTREDRATQPMDSWKAESCNFQSQKCPHEPLFWVSVMLTKPTVVQPTKLYFKTRQTAAQLQL